MLLLGYQSKSWDAVKPKSNVDIKFVESISANDKLELVRMLKYNPTVFVRDVDKAQPPRVWSTRAVIAIAVMFNVATLFVGYSLGYVGLEVVSNVAANGVDAITMTMFALILGGVLYFIYKVHPVGITAVGVSLMAIVRPHAVEVVVEAFNVLLQQLAAYWADIRNIGGDNRDEPPPA